MSMFISIFLLVPMDSTISLIKIVDPLLSIVDRSIFFGPFLVILDEPTTKKETKPYNGPVSKVRYIPTTDVSPEAKC